MAWLEVTIHVKNLSTEEVAARLTARGFSDLVVEDQQEFETFLDKNRDYWDYIDESLQVSLQGLSQIKLYLPQEEEASLSLLQDLVQQWGLEMEQTLLPETDWEENWKENYPPVLVGDRLVVQPYWLETAQDGRIPVILDPGLTFGTGAHPSTQMVMAEMETRNLSGAVCLDLGSGSGILSITALRLGAKKTIGVDIDPKAEDMARENAGSNGYGAPEFTALTGNVIDDRKWMETLAQNPYDLVLVNIVADVIIALAPILPRFLQENSELICSGILHTRLEDVTKALTEAGLEITNLRAQEDWRCVCAKRRA